MSARQDRGSVATYIPEIACVDPNQFGIAVIATDGRIVTGGDARVPFSIQ
ncbi:MAG: glutaminase, partial [Pseudomonadota bacterium]